VGRAVRAILDTSVVIATDVEPLEGDLAISAITLAELHFGVLVAKNRNTRAERLRRLLLVQRTFDALPLNEGVAASYGERPLLPTPAGRQERDRWICSLRPPHTRIRPASTPATPTTSTDWTTSSRSWRSRPV
jgi:hypothetical protein